MGLKGSTRPVAVQLPPHFVQCYTYFFFTQDVFLIIRQVHRNCICVYGCFYESACNVFIWASVFGGYANNKGTHRTAHLRSLISAFVIRLLESIMSRHGAKEISIFFLSFFFSIYTAWRSLSSIIGRCTLYTPGCRMKAYK